MDLINSNKYSIKIANSFKKEFLNICIYFFTNYKNYILTKKFYKETINKIYPLNYSPERYSKIYDKFNNRNFSKNSY